MPTDPRIIGEALGLTDEEMHDSLEREQAYEDGKPAMIARINENQEKMAPDPYAGRVKRTKKPVGTNERRFVERNFQSLFDTWFHRNRHRFTTSCLVELKSTDTDRFYYAKIEPHQHEALGACATDEGVYHRIQSDPHMFQTKKPSDSMYIRNGKGFLAVMFHQKQRGNSTFYMIPYPRIVEEMERGEKGLSEETAGRIGTRCTL